jgi:hypothetical protein
MMETEEVNPERDADTSPAEPEPPATEEEIAGLDNYFEKGLREPDEDLER